MQEKKKYEFFLTDEEFYAIQDVLKIKFDILDQEQTLNKLKKQNARYKSQHKCKHPNGQTNLAFYDPKTDVLEIKFSISQENPNGIGKLKFLLHK